MPFAAQLAALPVLDFLDDRTEELWESGLWAQPSSWAQGSTGTGSAVEGAGWDAAANDSALWLEPLPAGVPVAVGGVLPSVHNDVLVLNLGADDEHEGLQLLYIPGAGFWILRDFAATSNILVGPVSPPEGFDGLALTYDPEAEEATIWARVEGTWGEVVTAEGVTALDGDQVGISRFPPGGSAAGGGILIDFSAGALEAAGIANTLAADEITDGSARLNGIVNPTPPGAAEWWFEIAESEADLLGRKGTHKYVWADEPSYYYDEEGASGLPATATASLEANTTYYYRLVLWDYYSEAGEEVGNVVIFKTLESEGPPAPVNTVAPAVTGTAQVGQTLGCSTGTWENEPESHAYQWQRSATGEGGWSNIGGATASTYKLTAEDEGKYVRCVVTATNAGGSTPAASAATAKVEGEPAEAAPAYPVPAAREPSTRLAISLLNPSGSVAARWGPDEAAVGDIPRGLTFGTSDPGGFKDSNVALARELDRDWPDLRLLRDIRMYGAGDRTAWEGRLQETPMRQSDDYSASPGAVGHIAELDDDPSFRELYVGRDYGAWRGMDNPRKLNILGAGFVIGDASADIDPATGLPSLAFDISGSFTNGMRVEAWFDAGAGCKVGSVFWERISRAPNAGSPSAAFEFYVFVGGAGTVDQHTAAADSDPPTTFTPSTPDRLAALKWHRPGPLSDVENNMTFVRRLAVFGDHGLPKRGDVPNQGYYGDDVIANIVSRTAPRLRFTTGEGGSIRPAPFVIPHLHFDRPTKGSDAVLAVNAYFQRFFGVYEDRTFFWLPTDSYRKRWRIRRSAGHDIDLVGPQAEDAYNGVIVKFTDGSGLERVVAPIGCATADATSALLEDTDPRNPVNAAGIPRKWGELQLGFVTDDGGAIQVGAAWLAMKLQSANGRGSVSAAGCVQDDATGVYYPAWYMRAGDSAVITDGDNIERRIIETRYEHDSLRLTATLDATPHKTEAIMERMGVVLVGVAD